MKILKTIGLGKLVDPSQEEIDAFSELLKQGDVESVRSLLQKDKRLLEKAPDAHGSWLHAAVVLGKGSPELINVLLEHGLFVDTPDSRGRTPLYYTLLARSRDDDSAMCLLEAGADPSVKFDGVTSVHLAAKLEDAGVVIESLINCGATADEVHEVSGVTPLFLAAYLGHTENAGVLLNAGARPDRVLSVITSNGDFAKTLTPLEAAVESGHAETAELLQAWMPTQEQGNPVESGESILETVLSSADGPDVVPLDARAA